MSRPLFFVWGRARAGYLDRENRRRHEAILAIGEGRAARFGEGTVSIWIKLGAGRPMRRHDVRRIMAHAARMV